MASRFRRVAPLLAAGLAAANIAPARAHCGDICTAPLPYTLGPLGDEIAADGVLAFPVAFGRADSAIDFFTVTVEDAQATPVDGTLELQTDFSVLIWRPSQPWVAGATYQVTTRIDTAAWAEALYGAPPDACITDDFTREVTIAAEPLPAPAAPPIVVTETHTIVDSRSLDALVCCDGALPYLDWGPGSCPTQALQIGAGHCARLYERGTLNVDYTLDDLALPPAERANLAARLLGPDGAPLYGLRTILDGPACLRVETLDLARGTIFVEERCHGDALADQLGQLERDPTAELTDACEGPAYVCAVVGNRWDRERCTTWPDGADFEFVDPAAPPTDATPTGLPEPAGCGCATDPGPVGLGALLLALGLRRRRPRPRPA